MLDPVLHLLVGPNGAGKSTLFDLVIGPSTRLEFVNADVIAASRWPGEPAARSYDAAAMAAERRSKLIADRTSFATETVFSHESKLELIRLAIDAGYLITLHVVLIPESLAVARVVNRVQAGGHHVPEVKVRERYNRLWPLVARAVEVVDATTVYDNTQASDPFRPVASFEVGRVVGRPDWPGWTPEPMRQAGR